MPLNILVVGAGICGPAFATLMQGAEPRTKITVVERHPELRIAGQQIDLKNQAVEIVKRMGLMDRIKSHCVEETGVEILDSKGEPIAFFGINPDGQRRTALTSEHEIMRGDLVRVFYEASLEQHERLKKQRADTGHLTYEFGKTITSVAEDNDGIEVAFTDGLKKRYDLVVGADGQGSRTRRLAFGQELSDAAFKSLGVHAAYFSVPRIEGEEGNAKCFNAPNKMLFSRTSNRPVTQFLLYTTADANTLQSAYRQPIDKQRKAFAECFRDVGWQTDRILTGLRTAENFYAHELGQIKMKHLCTGRAALLGDAGYCPTPFTGLGVTGCLIGAYVLAGELARHGNDSVPRALKKYDETVKPGVNEIQKLHAQLGTFFPSSRLGIWILHKAAWAMSKLDQLTWQPRAEEDFERWKVPLYPELNLDAPL